MSLPASTPADHVRVQTAPPDNCSRCLAAGVLVGTRQASELDRGAIYGDYDCPKCGSEWFTGWWADELS